MPRMRGFTLLEILIVMVLIAILTAAAINTINFAVNDADAETEARRVAALSRLAAEEALFTGREYGLRIDDEQMQFFVFDDVTRQWQALDEDRIFHPRPLPESLDLDLVLEGQAVKLGDDNVESSGDEELPDPPQLVFLSSGQVTPFTLTVSETGADGATWTVEADLLGRVEVKGAPD